MQEEYKIHCWNVHRLLGKLVELLVGLCYLRRHSSVKIRNHQIATGNVKRMKKYCFTYGANV